MKEQYVSRYHQFIDDFLLLIGKDNAQQLMDIITSIFTKNIDEYRTLGSPLYLNADQAENLGMCSISSGQLLEELAVLIIQQ